MLKISEIHVLLVIIVQHFQQKNNFYANDDVIMNIHHIHNLCA